MGFVTAAKAIELFWSDDRFETEVRAKGELLKKRLSEITASASIANRVKGRGMMRGIEMKDGDLAGDICARCFDNGLIIETSGANDEVVKVLCPLTITQEQLNKGLDILAEAVSAIDAKTAKAA